MEKSVHITGTISEDPVRITLPASKSISNRALIIRAIAGGKERIRNLSAARDTQLMKTLLSNAEEVLDVQDAGTTMRFLTAYMAVSDQHCILQGTNRMHERPIRELVEALKQIGADIYYLKEHGFPPLEINPFPGQRTSHIQIPGDISSQYISALMMIAPSLDHGLHIQLTGNTGSRPYIEMTAEVMKAYGVAPLIQGPTISIPYSHYLDIEFEVEPDWSAASYWYSFMALTCCPLIHINGLHGHSIQGDRKIVEYMEPLGVSSQFTNEGVALERSETVKEVSYDLADTPDLAQTLAVVCAAKGIKAKFTGLESLRIKETDRILALQNELGKLNSSLTESNNTWILEPSSGIPEKVEIETYHDHRMAMAFAPLASLTDLHIRDPKVVRKSYPGFWDDVRLAGFDPVFT